MNKLEEMKKSCKDFRNDLKTGNLTWYLSDVEHWAFGIEINENHLLIMLDDCDGGFFSLDCHLLNDLAILKSTTAKEAAIEALGLVRIEAQKLVDALSEKEPSKIEHVGVFSEYIKRLTQLVQHAPVNTKHNDTLVEGYKYALKIAKEMYSELETKDRVAEPFWIPIDKDNLPKGVSVGIHEKEQITRSGIIFYSNHYEMYFIKDFYGNEHAITHYHEISKYPKPQ